MISQRAIVVHALLRSKGPMAIYDITKHLGYGVREEVAELVKLGVATSNKGYVTATGELCIDGDVSSAEGVWNASDVVGSAYNEGFREGAVMMYRHLSAAMKNNRIPYDVQVETRNSALKHMRWLVRRLGQ